ncbi:hypothetical protein EBZ39_05255 [bacterium]|nr:hypothetical protein [bacterium]
MALIKEKILPNGAKGNYWKITRVDAIESKMILVVWITLFQSKEKADNNLPLGRSYSIEVKLKSKEDLKGNLLKKSYESIIERLKGARPVFAMDAPGSFYDDLKDASSDI